MWKSEAALYILAGLALVVTLAALASLLLKTVLH
jgi:hypothetical protein